MQDHSSRLLVQCTVVKLVLSHQECTRGVDAAVSACGCAVYWVYASARSLSISGWLRQAWLLRHMGGACLAVCLPICVFLFFCLFFSFS